MLPLEKFSHWSSSDNLQTDFPNASFQLGYSRRNAIVGQVAKREPEALFIQITSDDTVRISRATITRLAVSHGVSRRRSAAGTALMGAALYTALPPSRGEYFDREHLQQVAFGAAFGGLLGAVFPSESGSG